MNVKQVFAGYDWRKQQAVGFRYCPICRHPLHRSTISHRLRPACPGCGFIQYMNPAPAISVLIVDGDRVLLGKRGAPPGKDKWAIPSGYVEYEDDFLTTALREAKEETGLDVEIQAVINVVSSFFSPGFHFLALYLLAHPVGGELAAGDDLAVAKWFALADPLPEMAFEEDVATLEMVATGGYEGLPVDPGFARTGVGVMPHPTGQATSR